MNISLKYFEKNFLKFKILLPFLSMQSIRFDKYLKDFFFKIEKNLESSIKQSEIEKAVRKKFFKINDSFLKLSSLQVQNSDEFWIKKSFYDEILQKKQNFLANDEQNNYIPPKNLLDLTKKSIIFEDENILILNKFSGICVQAGTKIFHSLDRILNAIYGEVKIVHRLDKKTTGVLVFAKNLEYAQKISKLLAESNFENKLVQKKYVLIAKLLEKENKEAKIFLKDQEIFINERLNPIKIGSEEIVVCDKKYGKSAKTKFKLLENFEYQNEIFYKIEAEIFSGRKHQIRAHLAHVGFVILGDNKYEKFLTKNATRVKNSKEIFLHAKILQISSLGIDVFAKEPNYFSDFFNIEKKINN